MLSVTPRLSVMFPYFVSPKAGHEDHCLHDIIASVVESQLWLRKQRWLYCLFSLNKIFERVHLSPVNSFGK